MEQPTNLREVLTTEEVADLLRISVKTFYRRARTGALPFGPIPKMRGRYSRDVVLAAINNTKRAA